MKPTIDQLIKKLWIKLRDDYIHPRHMPYALDAAHEVTDPEVISAKDLLDFLQMEAEQTKTDVYPY